MNLKLYLVVKCTNEGVDSAQAFANEKAAKEFFKDEVDSEIAIATDGGYFNYHISRKNCVTLYYREGGWMEIEIIEDEIFVED